jgi:F0F1-type ATP synthase membrane subunit c/vacuolar-type H+-ATPase subunit K
MASKARLIGAVLAASLAATASIALAQSGARATQGADRQTSEPKSTGHMTPLAEHCNSMMKSMWQ